MINRKEGFLKFPSSVFFNLFALAIFLAVVIVLHQVLKKPEFSNPAQQQRQEEEITQATVDLVQPEVVEVVKAQPVPSKPAIVAKKKVEKKKISKKYVPRKKYVGKKIEKEPTVEELDSEQARLQYLQETNKQLPNSSKVGTVYQVPAKKEIRVDDLDNEAARNYYQEQNRLLSKQ
ncbi:MAG: hypothetical protein ABH859_01455 [Pseudomonadota bacterium]